MGIRRKNGSRRPNLIDVLDNNERLTDGVITMNEDRDLSVNWV